MKKLIVHIGYPKTASSSLQLNLFTQLMRKGKVEYLNHLELGNNNLGQVSVKNILSYILGLDSKADYLSEIEEIAKINKTLTIISSESISHVSEKSLKASYKTGAVDNAEKIKRLLSPYFDSVEILITIRSQRTMIPSYFTQEYFNIVNDNPEFKDIGVWIDRNFGEDIEDSKLIFNYNVMYSTYAKHFGKENVHVLIYEDLLHDKNHFYSQLSNILELEPKIVQEYFESIVHNKTVKSKKGGVKTDKQSLGSLVLITINKIYKVNNDTLWFNHSKRILKKMIPKSILNFKVGNSVILRELTNNELRLISERFNINNQQLIEKAGLDEDKMASYEYIYSEKKR